MSCDREIGFDFRVGRDERIFVLEVLHVPAKIAVSFKQLLPAAAQSKSEIDVVNASGSIELYWTRFNHRLQWKIGIVGFYCCVWTVYGANRIRLPRNLRR